MVLSTESDTLAAYAGFEDLTQFDAAALAAYRAALVERTAEQSAFLRPRLGQGSSVLEVGSGNGRLLVDLARDGTLRFGLGVEISESRTAFAQAWAEDEGIAGRLELVAGDARTVACPTVDAALCITGAFAYFDAIEPDGGARLLDKLAATLRPGGTIVLELYPHPSWQRLLAASDGELRLWHELPAADPWRFYLSHLVLDPESGVLSHHKTFVHRETGEVDGSRREHLRLYDGPALRHALEAAGFCHLALFGDWAGHAYDPGDELLIAVARARA
ncbi:MAG TPA: class I SAM-dependent methyltransferase [Baekduia sp.]|uniref:SAM-dependent methyltransferase n=1 Tax=Baekduia sp. TaxID=2600305 RepID=UPI002BC8FFC5|nr:class I SAM-dependent methyltransferase [Baekduia sp.]HMJ33483.1 class I SAM-dependent methyltransferase [Baekduia sp.]